MSKRAIVLLFVMLFTLTSCYRANVIYDSAASQGKASASTYSHSLVGGLINVGKADNAASSCLHGIARVQTKFNGVSILATVLTGSIYTPLRVRVWCSPEREEEEEGEEGLDIHELIDVLERAENAEEALKILNEAKLSREALDAVEEAFLNGASETDAPAEAPSED